jgi:predicted dehydrogenase
MAMPTILVAILGCDSTHTSIFANLLQSEGLEVGVIFRIHSLWGEDSAEAYLKAVELGLERNSSTIENALEGADIALVLGRFGRSHYLPTKLALSLSIPTFVDKPFTENYSQAFELVGLAKNKHVPLFSTSALRFSNEVSILKKNLAGVNFSLTASAPASCIDMGFNPAFESVFFYGVHAVEMIFELMGSDLREYYFKFTNEVILVFLNFGNKKKAKLNLVRNAAEFYKICIKSKEINIEYKIQLDGSYNKYMMRELINSFMNRSPLVKPRSTLLAIEILSKLEERNLIMRQE